MNNRGQSLIMFVLILPLLSMFIAFFIDSSLCMMEKSKIDFLIIPEKEENFIADNVELEKESAVALLRCRRYGHWI